MKLFSVVVTRFVVSHSVNKIANIYAVDDRHSINNVSASFLNRIYLLVAVKSKTGSSVC